MKPRSLLLMAVAVMATAGFIFSFLLPGNAGEQPLILARMPGPGYDTIAPPPPPPPAEIRGVPGPPPEVRPGSQMEEIRRMAPPEDLQKGPGEAPGAPGDRSGALAEAAAGLELAVVSLGLSSATPKVGERVFATATMRNKGSQALSGVRVRFFLGQVQVGERVVEVAAGGSATVSVNFVAARAGAQNLKVQVDPGGGLAALALARGLTVTGAAKTDVEDFTTPTPKSTATAPLAPQRLQFDKPGAYAPAPDISRQPPPNKGTDGRGGKGQESPEGGIPLGKGLPSPIPEDLTGQTKVARGPHGEVIGWGDGIYGVEGTGTGIPAPPPGLAEFDKLLAEAMKGFPPGTGGPDLGFYGGIDPSKGFGKWAEGGGSPGFNKALTAFSRLQGQKDIVKSVTFGQSKETGQTFVSWKSKDGSSKLAVYNKDGSGYNSSTSQDGEVTVTDYDKNGNITKETTYRKDGSIEITTYKNGKPHSSKIITPAQRAQGSGGLAPEEAGVKPSPKTPDPELARLLMKDPGKRKTDPRIGQVGDPPQLVAVMTGAAPAGTEGIAAGGGKIVATWHFAGVKPGAFLKGPRDPDLPGGAKGGGLRADLRRFILPDPPEAKAITAALARAPAAGAGTVAVSSVAGAVQVLKTQEGKQGWTPLVSGDKFSSGSVIRTGEGGGEVAVADLKASLSMSWSKIHSSANHTVYLLSLRK